MITVAAWRSLIREKSLLYNVPENLIMAIIWQESRGNCWAYRYEPHYPYLYTPSVFAHRLAISLETEVEGQKISWGLMQIMGGKARELGHDGYLTELIQPAVALDYGVKFLSKLIAKHGLLNDVIAAYNAGTPVVKDGAYTNQKYVDEVNAHMKEMAEHGIA